QVTSGYREGDPYSHGKHNAIDIALPGVVNGSPRYTEAANYAFEKFANKIGYVITNGKVRDRSGQSGTGVHDDWRTWPAGDHYDHVHLNGIKDPQNTQISGDSMGGSGVERWRNVAIRALKMTGQYSTSNLNALLNQMRTESNGNPKAINLWDPNAMKGTPSKGLLQVIDPTFRAYAMPGFNSNIYDPLSNILASIRYALATYGSLSAAYR
ncbi:transglycosylase SLT domain-containing protein, partial [Enterococcus faecium]